MSAPDSTPAFTPASLRRSVVQTLRIGRVVAGLLTGGVSTAATPAEPVPPIPADHAELLARPRPPQRAREQVTDTDRQWWSFQPLQQVEPPGVQASGTVRHPIDRFILAKLEGQGLGLNAAADRRTRLRRATFGLHGLPPTPEELAEFVTDERPDAWTRVVTRLLESPRFGERWARHWLDVARFAESSGFEHDYDRPAAYHYRDFVVQAFNRDLPYDQFVQWQLAGDEFAPEEPLALMATGFLGAGVFPTQITANEVERVRYDALDDMLATTGTAMLGLTVGCARCHDHKFDPIPTRDYYRLLSTFTTTVRSELELDLQPDVTRQARAAFEREHAPRVAALKAYEATELPAKFNAWLKAGAPWSAPAGWEILSADQVMSQAGATFTRLEDGSYRVSGKNGDTDRYTFTAQVPEGEWRALRLEAMADPSLPHGGPGRAENGNLGLSQIRVFASPRTGGGTNRVGLVRPQATFQQNTEHLSVAASLDDNPSSGWAVDPQFGTNHAAVFHFDRPVAFPGGTRLRVELDFQVNTRHNLGRPRLAVTTALQPTLQGDGWPADVASLLRRVQTGAEGRAGLSEGERAQLAQWWRTQDPGWRKRQDEVEAHARQAPQPRLTKVLVCAEGHPAVRMHTQGADFFPETHFLHRGSTESKRGVATPGFLQVLLHEPDSESRWHWQPPAGAKFSGRRRSLATWMTDPEHGSGHLLARVIVNRLWQYHFGQGLVATPNDFGVQGTRPSHPELLDWLAGELIRGGWRLKPIHQLILGSATYQQDTRVTPAQVAADPTNVRWGRRLPRRLEGEAIRDALLYVAGVLDTRMYGPGTLDESSRRRSLYFTVKRSQLMGAMQSFDAPEPLVSQGVRPTTTVAPQALLLMNNPHVRSWAEAFARRLAEGPDTPLEVGVTRAYELALNRPPTADERREALDFLDAQLARYPGESPAVARGRALADFAQVVLSLNEFIYVD